MERALYELNVAVSEIAEVEPLISAGALRLTPLRPSLRHSNRLAILNAFGMDDNFTPFINFLQAAEDVPWHPGSFEDSYVPQMQELFLDFGMVLPKPRNLDEARARVKQLGAAILEVSWQFTVASLDPSCDIALGNGMEYHLAESLVAQGTGGSLGPGRHLKTLTLGRVPNLDPSKLTVPDALAIRRNDAFEHFRHAIRTGLDTMESSRLAGVAESANVAAFEETMQYEAMKLREFTLKSPFRERVVEVSSIATLGIAGAYLLPPSDHGTAIVAGGTALLSVLLEWYRRGQGNGARNVSHRYLSMLGGLTR